MESDRSVSLPVNRELHDLQMHLAYFYLEAFEKSSEDERNAEAAEAMKGARDWSWRQGLSQLSNEIKFKHKVTLVVENCTLALFVAFDLTLMRC